MVSTKVSLAVKRVLGVDKALRTVISMEKVVRSYRSYKSIPTSTERPPVTVLNVNTPGMLVELPLISKLYTFVQLGKL